MDTSKGLFKKIMSKTGLYNAQPQAERRRSKRYQIDMPLKYRIYLPSCPAIRTPLLTARIYDLSEHGIGLLTNILDRDGLHIVDPSHQTHEQCHRGDQPSCTESCHHSLLSMCCGDCGLTTFNDAAFKLGRLRDAAKFQLSQNFRLSDMFMHCHDYCHEYVTQ